MIKRCSIIIIIATCLGVFSFLMITRKSHLSVETYRVDNGWGYKLVRNSKKVIDQPYMPCIEGNHPFPQEQMAQQTGELVIEKMKKKEYPAITKNELITILKK